MGPYVFKGQTSYYQGKVRDVYTIENKWLVMIASDRISAFDVVLPNPIPNKGQVLNEIAAFMLAATEDICPNWLLSVPAQNVSVGRLCQPFRVEMVVRGFLTGHAWRFYNSGGRKLCGVDLPEHMKENQAFDHPVITPSTKADHGHDEDISRAEIIERGLVEETDYTILEQYSLNLFQRGTSLAAERGLLLVDTKYEFGKIGNEIYLMDEIHTPDSSRYFYADGYKERLLNNDKQKQLSKEFVREWLIDNNFMGKAGQIIPKMTGDWIDIIRNRYIELFEILIGKQFIPASMPEQELFEKIAREIERLP